MIIYSNAAQRYEKAELQLAKELVGRTRVFRISTFGLIKDMNMS